MSSRPKRLLLIAAVLAVAACGQQPQPSAKASIEDAPAARPVAHENLGVPECDDYLDKYQACVTAKAPEAARSALVQSLNQTRNAWRSALTNPASKEALARACLQAHDTARPSLAAYGCTDF